MSATSTKVVFDCMVYAQAMISPAGPSAACFERVWAGELHLIWSDYVLREIRELPTKLPARLKLFPERVEAFIAVVAPFAEHVVQIPEIYVNPFDRDDSHYVNLAVARDASVISSRDGDLLRLMDEKLPEGYEFRRRFPHLQILPPDRLLEFLRRGIV
jgi:putative PIN family toxin of toxin-antitoxin system